ncbi:MAG: hypothetical protein PHO42_02140 [Candidatus Omnitrophica bacterium]|nr:hypothetical protein [Candidatus Omnitrophota bacterium]
MNKLFMVLILVALTNSLCFAQQPVIAPKQTAPIQPVTKTLTGKIDTVTLADPMKGITSSLIVSKDDGNKTAFGVVSVATIYDADMKAITLDKLNKGDKVEVKYSTGKDGVNQATLITVLK